MLVGWEQTVAGLHASDSHRPLSRLTGYKHRLLVRLLRHGNLLQERKNSRLKKNKIISHQSTKKVKVIDLL